MALMCIIALFAACAFTKSTQKVLLEREYGIPLFAIQALLEDWVLYSATLGIGSGEGQLFNAIVDINTAGAYIESTRFTYHTDGAPAYFLGITVEVQGILSYDTLRLGQDVVIPNHTFIETISSKSIDPFLYDSVLGLGPTRTQYVSGRPGSNVSFPGVFEEYMSLNIADDKKRNKFSLLAPYALGGTGDLSFGTSHSDLYEGELVRHEIYPRGAGTWQLKAPIVRVFSSSGYKILERNLDNYVVHFDSTVSRLAFPKDSSIAQTVFPGPWMDNCDALDSFPTLVLDFDGQEIILEGRDYFIEARDLWNAKHCQNLLYDMNADKVDTEGNNFIIFGTDFLKMVYAVFDWDDQSISFAKPNRDALILRD